MALKLEITPHLNESESIRLEIDSEISDVPDGQTRARRPHHQQAHHQDHGRRERRRDVVLGGLQKESESETVEKVPFLGDIPLLGALFRTKSKQRIKQDLLIVLTPYVIRGPEDLRRIFERKLQDQHEFALRFDAHPNFAAPTDPGRGHGLLVEIDRTAKQAEHDAELVRQAELSLRPAAVQGRSDDAAAGEFRANEGERRRSGAEGQQRAYAQVPQVQADPGQRTDEQRDQERVTHAYVGGDGAAEVAGHQDEASTDVRGITSSRALSSSTTPTAMWVDSG